MIIQEKIPARYPEDRSILADLGSWWVLHIKPNCEKKVATYLWRRDISYYFPLYRRAVGTGPRRVPRVTESPLFRGYLCLALDKKDHGQLYETSKFVRIIPVEDQERFVTELQAIAKAIESGVDLSVKPGLVPGKRAVILSGPLEGAEGVVVRQRNERSVALSVKMFNQTVLVRLDPFTKVAPT